MPLPRAYRPDVVIPLDDDPARLLDCVQPVLESAGPVMGRLVIYGAFGRSPGLLERLESLHPSDDHIVLVESSPDQGRAHACREALTACCGDLVLLNSRYHPPSGWLDELAQVAHAEERTACVSPLVEMSETWLAGRTKFELSSGESFEALVRGACTHLPRWTTIPDASPACVYLRREAIEAVGLFDPSFSGEDAALSDWVRRAQSVGLVAKQANHLFVPLASGVSLSHHAAIGLHGDGAPGTVFERDSQDRPQLERFNHSLDAHLAGHAVFAQAAGKVSVALDFRGVPPEQVGTRTYAVNLAQAWPRFGRTLG